MVWQMYSKLGIANRGRNDSTVFEPNAQAFVSKKIRHTLGCGVEVEKQLDGRVFRSCEVGYFSISFYFLLFRGWRGGN